MTLPKEELLDFIHKNIVGPYGDGNKNFNWNEWGYVSSGIGDCWVWKEDKLNSSTEAELWELIARCSMHWENKYRNWDENKGNYLQKVYSFARKCRKYIDLEDTSYESNFIMLDKALEFIKRSKSC